MHYTSRQGGGALKKKVIEHLMNELSIANQSGLAVTLSLKNDFPYEWNRFTTGTSKLEAVVKCTIFPCFTNVKGKNIDLEDVRFIHAETMKWKELTSNELVALTSDLQDDGTFTLVTDAIDDVLIRDSNVNAFVLIRYSLQ